MTPIHETGRFPILNFLAAIAASILLGFFIAFLSLSLWRVSPLYVDEKGIIGLAFSGFIAIVAGTIGAFASYWLIQFSADHLLGKQVLGDISTSTTIYACSYVVTPSYVLPYAYNYYTRQGDPFCDLYLSFSYAEIRQIYSYLRKKHRIIHRFHTLALPSHLGKRTPLLSRDAARRILAAMTTTSNPHAQRVVLCYPFYPTYPSSVTLPEHQVFLSKHVVFDLLSRLSTDSGYVPNDAGIVVNTDVNESVSLTASYLRESLQRIATDDELVYMPLQS